MKFEPLIDLIEDSVSGLKSGVTLFINMMPSDVTSGVVLKDSFAGTSIDGEIPDLRKGRFQAASRAKTYEEARTLIEEVTAVLTMNGVALNGMVVKSIRPLHEPIPYMPSIGNLVEFSVNFSAIYGIVAE